MTKNIVVVGAGQAAAQFAFSLRQHGFDGRVLLFGDEPYLPYERPPLSKRALVEDEDCLERILLRGAAAYEAAAIEVCINTAVSAISRRDRRILLFGGGHFDFDACVIATGASPRRLPLPGVDLEGVCTLRSYDDAVRLRQRLRPSQRLVVVGGGYLGLEVAAAARARNCKVSVVEGGRRLMPRAASAPLAKALLERHHNKGVDFYLNDSVLSVQGDSRVTHVKLKSGKVLPADMVLLAVGAKPNVALAKEAGILCSNGITASAEGQSSCGQVYAIGDCSSYLHPLYPNRQVRPESVQSALYQARCAAAHLAGKPLPAPKYPTFWSNQYEYKIQIAGLVEPGVATYDVVHSAGQSGRDAGFSVQRYENGVLAAVECIDAPRAFVEAQQKIGKEYLG